MWLTDYVALDILITLSTIPPAIYGFVKSPLWGWIAGPIHRHRLTEREWRQRVERLEIWMDNQDTRTADIELAIAPTNGDKRSISDRLDTVKYNTRITNTNITALAKWLSDIHPNQPPPVILAIPERV